MKVTNLSSGSKGNSTFVASENTKILVDCGIGIKLLTKNLSEIGENVENIDAILITHEHSDHIGGLAILVKHNPGLHIFVNELVWKEIIKKHSELLAHQFVHFVEYEKQLSVGDFAVYAMENFHDSVSCASYIVSCGGGAVGICTDLGIITDHQVDMLSRCKVVYLECNHDKNMLASCGYPSVLKKRIAGNHGHLSNDQCAEAALKMVQAQTKVVVLSHISENSNLPEVAYSRVAGEFELANIKNVLILLSYQNRVGKTITIN